VIGLPGNPISTNQLVSYAKHSGLLCLPNNPVQAFDFLFHGPLAHELVFEQDQEITIRGGFHFNNLLIAYHAFVAGTTATAALAGTGIVVLIAGCNYYSQYQNEPGYFVFPFHKKDF